MKLLELYIAEREGAEIIFNDDGFLTYKRLEDDKVLVIDVFVIKEKRKSGIVLQFWKELIEKTNPKIVYGMTDRKALNWEASHLYMLNFGFIPYHNENTIIHYYMEIP